MELKDLLVEFEKIAEDHYLAFGIDSIGGGEKLKKLIATAFIAGRRKANLEHKEAKSNETKV